MSWFDTAGFASLAKTALKEAQKTIDKALDIQEDQEQSSGKTVKKPVATSDAEVSFFSTWGLDGPPVKGGKEQATTTSSSQSSPGAQPSTPSSSRSGAKITASSSLWGSFTGSFFENQQQIQQSEGDVDTHKEPKKAVPPRSLSLDLAGSTTVDSSQSPSTTRHRDLFKDHTVRDDAKTQPTTPPGSSSYPEVVMRKKDSKTPSNRLSVISSEGDRRSTESGDLFGSSTPDSDPASASTTSTVARGMRHSGSFESSSVEVITSPSSVEILGSNSNMTSPSDHRRSSGSLSPDGPVKSLKDDDEEEDEASVEDSFTSASETTLTTTVLEHSAIMLKSTSSLDTSFSEGMSPRENLTRQQLSMVLTHVTPSAADSSGDGGQEKVVTQPPKLSGQDPKKDKSVCSGDQVVITQPPKLASSPNNALLRVSESSSLGGGQTLETSSCDEEGTLMGSSDEGGGGSSLMMLSGDSQTNVSTMIAEAMNDQAASPTQRDHSPISSEKSDLVKICSSELASGDELETGTSSDIEVISSPTSNGSSTSRQSPTRMAYKAVNLGKILVLSGGNKVKGHHREPSEASSGGSDECSEVDKLLKRIAEMTDVLEARESKLIDLSRINAELHETISDLKQQLERLNEAQEIKNMSDEFTRRLAVLEKKFQQAISEKESLRKQLEQARSVAAQKELDMDKDQLIQELRTEGEKLSKQQLVLNNTIKKLRANEKENSKAIASLKEQLSNTSQELERSKKAMAAKEEMERSQIEAIHNLTKQVSSLEKELTANKNSVSTITSALVAAQKELQEKEESFKKAQVKMLAEREEMEENVRGELNTEVEATQQQVITLQTALEDLRRQMIAEQKQHSKVEMNLRREVSELRGRAEAAERKLEEASEGVRLASQPLATQLQAQAMAHEQAQAQWERHEAALNATIAELENKISSLTASERAARVEHESSSSQIASLMDKIKCLTTQNESLIGEINAARDGLEKIKVLKNSELKKYVTDKARLQEELDEKRREVTNFKDLLSVEKAALDAEKRKSAALQEQLRVSKLHLGGGSSIGLPSQGSPPDSPTVSLGNASMTDSVSSSAWPNYQDDDAASTSGRYFDLLRPVNNTSFVENLQAQLKLREGEVQQLQWEVARLDSERSSLRDEVAALSSRLEIRNEEVASLAVLKTQYDALLQMYGEKLEESQELRMDLEDMKDMYKAQIEELLKKANGAGQSSSSS